MAEEAFFNKIDDIKGKKGAESEELKKRNSVYSGPITNAFMATNDDIGTIHKGDALSGSPTEYRTAPIKNIYFSKYDLFDNTLSPATQRLFLFNLSKLAKNVQKNEKNIDLLRSGSMKPFSLKEYMEECGLKDQKEAKRTIKNSIKELIGTRVTYKIEINEGGQQKVYAKNTDILSLTLDITDLENKKLTEKEYLDHCIEKGLVYMNFDLELTSILVKSPLLYLPKQLFKLDIRHNPHALSAGYYLVMLGNQERNKVSLANLITACPDLPFLQLAPKEQFKNISTKEEPKDSIRLYKHILEPLKKTLENLEKEGILAKYSVQDNEGKKITLEKITKNDLNTSFIIFELTKEAKPKDAGLIEQKLS